MSRGAETIDTVNAALAEPRTAGQRVVFTNGCFDLLHPGHIAGLRAARALGDILVVGLNSDESVRELKGTSRPVMSEGARAEMLAELRCVDHVVIFTDSAPTALLQALRPDVYVKGADWEGKPLPEADIVRANGGDVAFIDLVSGYSTTSIIEKLRSDA